MPCLIFNRFTVSDFEEHNKNNYQISWKITVHFVHSNLQRTEADPLPRATHLKGIEPPHMVPETTALSTELQVHNEKHNF